jgi:hypothetical protein
VQSTRLVSKLCLLSCAAATACVAGGGENELRTRAAFDFKCPEAELALTKLQDKNWGATTNHGAVYGVEGCGHRATYVNNAGAWVLNSDQTP